MTSVGDFCLVQAVEALFYDFPLDVLTFQFYTEVYNPSRLRVAGDLLPHWLSWYHLVKGLAFRLACFAPCAEGQLCVWPAFRLLLCSTDLSTLSQCYIMVSFYHD